jgi:Immunity protein Imm1
MIRSMVVTARWIEGQAGRRVGADDVAGLWEEIEGVFSHPVVLLFEAGGGAELGAVIGEPEGTVLTYRPSTFRDTGTGSLHSTGESRGGTLVTAYYFGHHSEFPREWLVPRDDGLRALSQFCVRPEAPPTVITWSID